MFAKSLLVGISLVFGASAYCETSYTVSGPKLCTVPRSNLMGETCVPINFAPGTTGHGEVIKTANGLAENPIDRKLYALLSFNNKTLPRDLVEITNVTSGRVTHIANVGGSFAAIAFGCNGKLFGLTGKNEGAALYELSTTTGVGTLKRNMTTGNHGNALAYDFDNSFLYRAGTLPSGGFGIQKIDISTWQVTSYNVSGFASVGAMGYEGNNQFWLLDSLKTFPQLYSVSSTGGNATVLGTFPNVTATRKGWSCTNHSVVSCPTSSPTTPAPVRTTTTPAGGTNSTTMAPAGTTKSGVGALKVLSLLVVVGVSACFV